MMKYVPLRVYSVFSRGKGAVDAGILADFLKGRNIDFLSVTDPFSVVGWESFHKEAAASDMKPLLGMEICVQRVGSLLVYPLTMKGYFSLIASFNDKVFSKMEDVMVIYVPRRTISSRAPSFERIRQQVSPGNFYLGLEWNSNRWVVDLARDQDIPLVWAQPWKWVDNPEKYAVASAVFNHHPVSDILMGTRSGELPLFGPVSGHAITKRWGEPGNSAMKNTFVFASRMEFDFSGISSAGSPGASASASSGAGGESELERLPSLVFSSTPSYARTGSPGTILEEVVNREMRKRKLTIAERERTFRELDIIKKQGFSSYFLIAAEIGAYCRKQRIYFNLRGSAVSSFILYLLGVSRVNPLAHDLLFERFVNSLRDDLPDIDIDIDSSRRAQVLKWVFETYKNRVVFVSTHKFFKARSALYEVARCYGLSVDDAHKLSKEFSMFAPPAELKERARENGRMGEIYRMASLLDGVYKELSLHLGGVLFIEGEIRKTFPLDRSPGGFDQVVWDKDTIERLRIFKLDLLGVRGFDVIAPVAMEGNVDFTDPQVWETIRKARTIGCFQLESPLVRKHLLMVKPRNLQEIAITIAIIRPGPSKSGMKDAYIEKRTPIHPFLEKIFPYTRGTVIFEEQISVLLHTITGWNLELSEKIRRALKKKKGEEYRAEFFKRGRANGWKWADLEKTWKLADDFSQYAFNQGHSVAYAYSAYLSAWFKTRQPVNFFCRLLNSGGGYYPLPFYIEEAKKWGIPFLPPDVNRSAIGFLEEKGAIRTGLIFIKGVGRKLAEKIVEERGMGYNSLEDFIGRTRLGEKDLSNLMAVSAFQSLGHEGFSEEEKKENWKKYLGFIPDGSPAAREA
ncbi:MAG: DNA polymerase III subunit alpha [Candidatus Aminicenantes bacterium]|nr:MAG: DNA polymerase III subunit alpha [Candidatus Aminicenantes bacterium]